MQKGYRTLLMPSDLWPILPTLEAEGMCAQFTKEWKSQPVDTATVLKVCVRLNFMRRILFGADDP